MEIRVKAAIVFKVDGLDLDAVVKELQEDCKILEIVEDTVEYDDGSGDVEEAIKMIFFETSFSKMTRIRLKWNAFTIPEYGPYVLFPR